MPEEIDQDAVQIDEDGNPIEEGQGDLESSETGEGKEGEEGIEEGEEKQKDSDTKDIDYEALSLEKDQEISSLRQLTREGKRDISTLTKKLEDVNKILKDANLISEESEKEVSDAKASHDARNDYLSNIIEVMRVNPKYEDIDTVVSQSNFDDMIQLMAEAYVEDNPEESFNEVQSGIEAEVWGMKNPYKYMYDLIKTSHPSFIKGEKKEKEKSLTEGPNSLSDTSGGKSSDDVGWSASRIDAMDEDDLVKVPADVYEKYLQGKLK